MIAWRNPLFWAWCAVGAALVLFAAAETWLAPDFGWWGDEVFSLWATDPTIRLDASVARIVGDSNPPLYFALLRVAREFIADPRAAVMVVNALALGATAAFAIWTSWRAGALAWGLVAAAAFTLCGTTFFFLQEARAYFFGTCIAFAASWQTALVVASDAPRRPIWLAALGVIGSLTHFYAGLIVGCLAAGMVGHALFARRRDLLIPALGMGAAAAITFLLWFATAFDRLSNISWIIFTPGTVRAALWYVRSLAFGPDWMALPLLASLAFAARFKDIRSLLIVFGTAGTLFLALPIAISFKVPLIMGRYWAIGAPLLVVLLAACARALLSQGSKSARLAFLSVIALVLSTAIFGLAAAKRLLEIEPVWEGTPLVAGLVHNCPAGSVRVPSFGKFYASAVGAREDVFVSAEGAPIVSTRDAACPIIGWAEHVQRRDNYSLTAPDSELLGLIGVAGAPGEYRIARHDSGFVVLRADAPAIAASQSQ